DETKRRVVELQIAFARWHDEVIRQRHVGPVGADLMHVNGWSNSIGQDAVRINPHHARETGKPDAAVAGSAARLLLIGFIGRLYGFRTVVNNALNAASFAIRKIVEALSAHAVEAARGVHPQV